MDNNGNGSSNSTGIIRPFELEQYFAKYEFCTKYLLCCSDCESVSMAQLLQGAGEGASRYAADGEGEGVVCKVYVY